MLWGGRTKITLSPPGNFGKTILPLGKSFLPPWTFRNYVRPLGKLPKLSSYPLEKRNIGGLCVVFLTLG